jgi:predicted enzyme related to lactoylglutathione lyase
VSGEIVHIEIPGGAETSRARAFWSALFGWQFDEVRVPSAEYLLTRINEDQGAALSTFEPNKRGIRPYFAVDDIDAGIVRVAELRGKVYEKMAVPGSGWFALCRDPHGNQFGLWQSDPAAQPPSLDPALSQFHPGSDQG